MSRGATTAKCFSCSRSSNRLSVKAATWHMDFLAPATRVKELETAGESAMKASLAKGMPHGYEVGYRYFTINGRMLGHGEPVRVKQGERVLFHVLNGSATEIRSLALPGHSFKVVALDGNAVPTSAEVPVLWLGTAERISAIVEMNHPGVWIMGDLADDDRGHGMGIVVEYAGHKGKPVWTPPKPFHWELFTFRKAGATALSPDETFEMIFAKDNAADEGFNRWTINGIAFPMMQGIVPASFHLKQGKTLPPSHAQCQRRYPSHPSSPAQFRIDQARRQADRWCDEGCRNGRRISGSGSRLYRGQSWPYVVPLPSAAAHGLWLHDPVRLHMSRADFISKCSGVYEEREQCQ